MNTGQHTLGQEDYSLWKTRVRCALSKCKNIKEITKKPFLTDDGSKPYRVYKFCTEEEKSGSERHYGRTPISSTLSHSVSPERHYGQTPISSTLSHSVSPERHYGQTPISNTLSHSVSPERHYGRTPISSTSSHSVSLERHYGRTPISSTSSHSVRSSGKLMPLDDQIRTHVNESKNVIHQRPRTECSYMFYSGEEECDNIKCKCEVSPTDNSAQTTSFANVSRNAQIYTYRHKRIKVENDVGTSYQNVGTSYQNISLSVHKKDGKCAVNIRNKEPQRKTMTRHHTREYPTDTYINQDDQSSSSYTNNQSDTHLGKRDIHDSWKSKNELQIVCKRQKLQSLSASAAPEDGRSERLDTKDG